MVQLLESVMDKYVLIDFDHTLTDGEVSGKNCWVAKVLPQIYRSKKSPRYSRFLAAATIIPTYFQVWHNPNKDPKPWQVKFLSSMAKGVPDKDLYVSASNLKANEKMVGWISSMKKEGYKVAIVSMSPSKYIREWLKGEPEKGIAPIEVDEVIGLELKFNGNFFESIDRSDPYTNIMALTGSKKAKGYYAAKLIDQGDEVAYSIGNSDGDLVSHKDVVTSLKTYFDWPEDKAQDLLYRLEKKPILNLHVPVGKEPSLYENGNKNNTINIPLDEYIFNPV